MENSVELTLKQRLALFSGTGIAAETIVSKPMSEFTFDFLIQNGVRAINISTAGLRPLALRDLGVESARQLKQLGFDSLHLVDPVFAEDACAAYGSDQVVQTFLCDAHDAVALAGTEIVSLLGIKMQTLLELCAGLPTEAQAVLQQTTSTRPLSGVSGTTLLDTGLRATQLSALKIDPEHVRALTFERASDFNKFGFR
tara:strand:- start:3246 stop:3839 length:594 start_codon:yes stop_codon:yes gene_type:complete